MMSHFNKQTKTSVMKKSTYKLFISLFTLLISSSLYSTNYYVANNGNDNNNGTSTSTPWKSIEHINNQTFLPGDSILFKRGDSWHNEQLRIPSSGNPNQQLVFGAYGAGNRPEILGSVEITNWTNVGGNIWASNNEITGDPWDLGYDGAEIFFEENAESVIWGTHQAYNSSFSNLNQNYDWTWNSNKIYIYSSNDPNTNFESVEAPQLTRGIMLQDNNYVTIEGLKIRYCIDSGIYDHYATIQLYGLRVTHCDIGFIGQKDGAAAYGLSVHQSDAYYAYNEIHNCGRRGISLTIYTTSPITQSNVIIEHNHFHHGWHTTSLDCSTTGGHTIENIHFRYNLVEGDPNVELGGVNPNSNHIFCDDQSDGSGTVQDLHFYGNVFTYAHGSSIKVAHVNRVNIFNNTFYYFNPTLSNWQAHAYCGPATNVNIMNNIFCNNATTNMWAAIECRNATVGELTVDYNLYYNDDPGRRMFWVDGGTSYDVEQWEEYRNATGNDAHSPNPNDPQFKNVPADFSLTTGSPAIGAGTSLELVTKDFNGNPMNSPVDIGAIQFGSISGFNTLKKAKQIHVFPNPAIEKCEVTTKSANNEKYTIRVYDLQSKMIYESPTYTGDSKVIVPTSEIKSGIYLIGKYDKKGFTEVEKLIIYK